MIEQPEQPKAGDGAVNTEDGSAALVGGLLVAGGLLYAVYKGLQTIGSYNAAGAGSSGWEECRLYIKTETRTVATQGVIIGGVIYYDRSNGPSYTEYRVIVQRTSPDSRELYRSQGILDSSSVPNAVEGEIRNLRAQGWELSKQGNDAYNYQFRRRIR